MTFIKWPTVGGMRLKLQLESGNVANGWALQSAVKSVLYNTSHTTRGGFRIGGGEVLVSILVMTWFFSFREKGVSLFVFVYTLPSPPPLLEWFQDPPLALVITWLIYVKIISKNCLKKSCPSHSQCFISMYGIVYLI